VSEEGKGVRHHFPPTNANTSGPCANWTFNAANNRISGFGYDPAGDVTTDGGTGCTYTWDAERRLQSVSTCRTATFTTNALGQTVETLASNYRQEFILDLSGLGLASLNGSNGSWYDQDFFLGSQKIGNYIGTITQFDHFNQLTSTAMAFDGTGTWQQDQTFYPWGQQWKNVGTYDDLHFGTMTTDGELWYTNARRYSSNQGRWLSPDPLGGDITNPQSLNRYPYVLNNPTTLTDPSGLDACAQASDPRACRAESYWGLGNSINPYVNPLLSDEFSFLNVTLASTDWSYQPIGPLSTPINSMNNEWGLATSAIIYAGMGWAFATFGNGFVILSGPLSGNYSPFPSPSTIGPENPLTIGPITSPPPPPPQDPAWERTVNYLGCLGNPDAFLNPSAPSDQSASSDYGSAQAFWTQELPGTSKQPSNFSGSWEMPGALGGGASLTPGSPDCARMATGGR
jgi:RHS repeat-associated protein